jgi:hypothetical protein
MVIAARRGRLGRGERGRGPVKIRLHGTEDECRELAGRLPAITDVLSVSEPYPDRGTSRLVRVYVETRPYPVAAPHVTVTTESAPRTTRRRRELPPAPGGARLH